MTSSNKKPKSHLFITTLKFILTLCLAVYLGEDSSVRYNRFTSTLTVNELELFDQEKSQTLLVEYAEISIHLHRLLFKQLYVSEFLLEGTEIKIIKDQQSIIVTGVDVSASPETEQNEPVVKSDSDASSLDFTLVIPELKLNRVLFNSHVDGNPQTLLLNELLLVNASLSQLQQQVSLSIQALVNDAPLMLNSEISLQAGVGSINSTFSLEQLDLDALSPMLVDLGISVSGVLSTEGNPKLKVTDESIGIKSEQIVLSLTGLSLSLSYDPWVVEGASDVVTINNLDVIALPSGVIKQLTASVGTLLSQGNVGLHSIPATIV
jgi:hypothetical protein